MSGMPPCRGRRRGSHRLGACRDGRGCWSWRLVEELGARKGAGDAVDAAGYRLRWRVGELGRVDGFVVEGQAAGVAGASSTTSTRGTGRPKWAANAGLDLGLVGGGAGAVRSGGQGEDGTVGPDAGEAPGGVEGPAEAPERGQDLVGPHEREVVAGGHAGGGAARARWEPGWRRGGGAAVRGGCAGRRPPAWTPRARMARRRPRSLGRAGRRRPRARPGGRGRRGRRGPPPVRTRGGRRVGAGRRCRRRRRWSGRPGPVRASDGDVPGAAAVAGAGAGLGHDRRPGLGPPGGQRAAGRGGAGPGASGCRAGRPPSANGVLEAFEPGEEGRPARCRRWPW